MPAIGTASSPTIARNTVWACVVHAHTVCVENKKLLAVAVRSSSRQTPDVQ
jgi:hypothetical protein